MIWETEVGIMLDWPWKKPRSTDSTPTNSTAGARHRMANQLCSELMTPASQRQSSAMPRVPTVPMVRKRIRAAR